ncbi:CPBP family intramembrane glutamic endopeptidase [Lutibacter citreus]|uniref:CPBP family intramembrane glutamic endopeptidase n=1 Tax=Lutibacter citreus TaxID=2138210 RepID=UPI000DBE72AE|nr:CPBP family intramembrane glutamic endopeptidase [Lutibacter citreus]
MKRIIKKIQNNAILTILTTLILGVAIFFISKFLYDITLPYLKNYFDFSSYSEHTILKFYILILSILTILFLNNGSLKNYGFSTPKNINYLKMTLISVGIIIGSLIVGAIIFMGILNNIFPSENPKLLSKPNSLIELILVIWIWSSICEEILVRGLLQSFMNHLKSIKIFRLSLPVIISGLFFGAMHLSLLNSEINIWYVFFTVFNTSIMGMLAAFYREKSDSLIPPILIHLLTNVLGSIPMIILLINS